MSFKRERKQMTHLTGAFTVTVEEEVSWEVRLLWAYDLEQKPMGEALHFQSAYACLVSSLRTHSYPETPAQLFICQSVTIYIQNTQHNIWNIFPYIQTSALPSPQFLLMHRRVFIITWDRAHSRTEIILSCSGWKHIPTIPIGRGSVMEVAKLPSMSNLPKSPFHPLWVLALFLSQAGIISTIFPLDNLICITL